MSICLNNQTAGSFIKQNAITLLIEYAFIVDFQLYNIKND